MNIIQNIKYFVISFILLLYVTQKAICVDANFASDAYYRFKSWQHTTVMKESTHHIHQQLAHSVVYAHELCEDPSSNIAAFGFSIHDEGGTILKNVAFPLLFSSGKLIPMLPRSLNVVTIDERFSKTLDILSPREQLVGYIDFITNTLDLAFEKLAEVRSSLNGVIEPDQTLSIPVLRLESGGLDIPLGHVKHCEQCFIYELYRNPILLESTLRVLTQETTKKSEYYISLNILTYNDMCQRCFAACDRFLPILKA